MQVSLSLLYGALSENDARVKKRTNWQPGPIVLTGYFPWCSNERSEVVRKAHSPGQRSPTVTIFFFGKAERRSCQCKATNFEEQVSLSVNVMLFEVKRCYVIQRRLATSGGSSGLGHAVGDDRTVRIHWC